MRHIPSLFLVSILAITASSAEEPANETHQTPAISIADGYEPELGRFLRKLHGGPGRGPGSNFDQGTREKGAFDAFATRSVMLSRHLRAPEKEDYVRYLGGRLLDLISLKEQDADFMIRFGDAEKEHCRDDYERLLFRLQYLERRLATD